MRYVIPDFLRGLVLAVVLPSAIWAQTALSVDPNQDFSSQLPRIRPLDPADAIGSFTLQPGFRIELSAAEPLVTDPVAMSFDPGGRAYVVEMRDYSEQATERLGRVRLLEDLDHDGRFDRSSIFADQLSWPTAILCYDQGVFVGAAPDLIYLKDTDNDRVADLRETVFTGFSRDNVQGLMNSLRWGIDNRIHGVASSSGGQLRSIKAPHAEPVVLRGRDFSFDPRTGDLRPESGGAQHGMCFDDWGRKFVCSNSDHAQVVLFEDRYIARNPRLKAPSARASIAADGGQAEVFRISPVEPWRIVRTRLRVAGKVPGPIEGGGRAAGYFTSATGITICRADAYGDNLRGMVIVGDVGSNIVHRKRLESSGSSFVARRVDANSEFVASSDIWFRPVQFENGPDGCLYILDMYREVIEHPLSLPPQIKKHLDLTSGRDRGRLYRIVPDDYRRRDHVDLQTLPTSRLVDLLGHANAWHRETASRLLFERQDTSVADDLDRLAKNGSEPLARLHAVYALSGLSRLSAETILAALHDPDAHVREHAVRLSESFSADAQVRFRLAELAVDRDPRVRLQLAFSAGEFPVVWRLPVLNRLIKSAPGDSLMRVAVLSSLGEGAGVFLADLLTDRDFLDGRGDKPIIDELAEQASATAQPDEIAKVLKAVDQVKSADTALANRVLLGLTRNNPRWKDQIDSSSFGSLLNELVKDARRIVQDVTQSEDKRSAAASTLALGTFEADGRLLLELIDNRQPVQLQIAALRSLARLKALEGVDGIIAQWRSLGPAARAEAEELVFSQRDWTERFLARLDDETVPLRDIPAWRLQMIARSADAAPTAGDLASELLARIERSPRHEVVRAYQASLNLTGDAARGQAVFRHNCATCHRMHGEGHEVGPAMETVRNRGKQGILLGILDPNREVLPQYVNYVAQLKDGVAHTGIIAAETATSITLKQAENKTNVVLRDDLEELVSTGLSIMTEGLEKQIDQQAMADLLEYLVPGDSEVCR
jgi:putative membrane-bound dehydrogenase-like protein